MDQIIHDVCILNLPVLFGIDRGGLVEDGETHQGVFDIAHLRSIPNFTLLAPKDASELQDMIYTAIQKMDGPTAIRFPRDKAVRFDEKHQYELINYTQWETVHQGSQLLILAYGAMVEVALQSLPLLSTHNINPTIVNARCCKPLDVKYLEQLVADGYKCIVTAEEGILAGGFGTAVLEWSTQKKLSANHQIALPPIFCLGIPDHFVEHGARNILLDLNGLTPSKLADFVLRAITTT
jgi:1-deoxy-D-xylulose-5-phosphate synthase